VEYNVPALGGKRVWNHEWLVARAVMIGVRYPKISTCVEDDLFRYRGRPSALRLGGIRDRLTRHKNENLQSTGSTGVYQIQGNLVSGILHLFEIYVIMSGRRWRPAALLIIFRPGPDRHTPGEIRGWGKWW
jgi:hypothetical protein